MVFIAFYSKCNGRSLENLSRKVVDQAVFKRVQKVSRLYVGGHRGEVKRLARKTLHRSKREREAA